MSVTNAPAYCSAVLITTTKFIIAHGSSFTAILKIFEFFSKILKRTIFKTVFFKNILLVWLHKSLCSKWGRDIQQNDTFKVLMRINLVRIMFVRMTLVRMMLVKMTLVRIMLAKMTLVRKMLVKMTLVRMMLVKMTLVIMMLVKMTLVRMMLVGTKQIRMTLVRLTLVRMTLVRMTLVI
jgi:hypothetical protein